MVTGAILRTERERVGLSAADVARLMGCTPSNVAHLERSERPRETTIRQYRSALALWRMRQAETLRSLGELALRTSHELAGTGSEA